MGIQDRLFFAREDNGATILVPESQFGSNLSRTVELDAAQLLTLDTIPVVLVPGAGNGQVTVLQGITSVININGADGFSTGGSGQIDVKHADGSVAATPYANDTQWNANRITVIKEADIAGFGDDTADNSGDITVEVTGDANVIDQGAIVTNTKGAAGTTYAIGDKIFVDSTNAVLKVVTLSGSTVATYSVLDHGNNVPVGNGQTTTSSGAGTGFTLNVATIDKTANPVKVAVTVYYRLVNTILP